MAKAASRVKPIRKKTLKTNKKVKEDDARLDRDYNPYVDAKDDCDSVNLEEEPITKQIRVRKSKIADFKKHRSEYMRNYRKRTTDAVLAWKENEKRRDRERKCPGARQKLQLQLDEKEKENELLKAEIKKLRAEDKRKEKAIAELR